MNKLQTNVILEILGRPAEHIIEALNSIVTRLGSEAGIKILEKKIHDPIKVKDSKDLFTTFVDLTLELDSLSNYFTVIFAYMPANIELIHPENITLENIDFNEFGNKIIARLHEYDAIAKKALYENKILTENLREVAPHLFKQNNQVSEKKDAKPSKKAKIESKKKGKRSK